MLRVESSGCGVKITLSHALDDLEGMARRDCLSGQHCPEQGAEVNLLESNRIRVQGFGFRVRVSGVRVEG